VGPLSTVGAPHDHVVHFYGRDAELEGAVTEYLLKALRAGGVAVIIANPGHRASFELQLKFQGIDVDVATANGDVVSLDAMETLKRFLKDERPDPDLFRSVMGSLIDRATSTGGPVHVYGEMVGLLCAAGQVSSAIELETLWADLSQASPLSVYCAYRADALAQAGNPDTVNQLCQLHSAIVDEAPHGPGTSAGKMREELRTFPAHISSPRASRRFVVESLQGWADDELLADAALVVTELATNAVVHARSEFTVGIVRLENGARISVRDSGSHQWGRKSTSLFATHGRGLRLVAALTNSWGKSTTDGGKVVWAEFTGRSPVTALKPSPGPG
jgi:MEDS: MEthanogen/methylotroph, DcmR Sensory domain/Histidine kinase-like ATPase domain